MGNIIDFLLQNYGTLGLVVILVAGMAFFIIKELRRTNETLLKGQMEVSKTISESIATFGTDMSKQLTNDLREQNKKIFDWILNKEIKDAEDHQSNLIDRRNVTAEINKIIDNLRVELGSTRVAIIEFHNSFANQTGFPFLKYTITYEKISKGAKTIQQNYYGAQFSSICDVATQVLNDPTHMFTIYNKDEVEELCPILLTNNHNFNSCIWKGIFNNENNLLIGLLFIEYVDEIPDDYDPVSIITSARLIGELLTLTKPEEPECPK